MKNYTENYQLHQWEPGDDFLRTDFNEDFQKIDAAMGKFSKVGYVFGSYVGNNVYPRAIELGFQPTAVLLFTRYGHTNASGAIFGGLFTQEVPLGNTDTPVAQVTATGFELTAATSNRTNDHYVYLAFK